ncbi:glycosyltransferase family 4 protein [Paracoccus haeundaensis]|uniref:Glycosyltransferase family 4 protein n=2 Tax=Paracoccus haeundaensis TaxID=225362 RepID=A0A5C4R2A0_9RHOB|nr:glycosyltransferase family 4 protein [Paracoccus haeundaensis]
MDAARGAITIYNSIDAPALRIPDDLAARFDLFLTGAPWQSAEITARIPGARTRVLPIGPNFASDVTFHPTGAAKDRDVVYVACAQPYKRHDILFDAMERRPGTTALLVVGYGDDDLRADADRRGLDVEIVGPPGVDHDAVNRLINRARIGVVCGQHDGAPAILTEYQLAGLPVLANADLVCGLDHVPASAGTVASPGAPFAAALDGLLASPPADPRPDAITRWGWRASIACLGQDIDAIRSGRRKEQS